MTWLTINLIVAFYLSLKSHQNPWERKFPKILCQSPLILLSPFICVGMGWKSHWFHQSEIELCLHGYGNTARLLFHISLPSIIYNSGEHCFWIAILSPNLFFQEYFVQNPFPSPEGSLRRNYTGDLHGHLSCPMCIWDCWVRGRYLGSGYCF